MRYKQFLCCTGTKRESMSIKEKLIMILWVICKNQGASSKPCVRSTMNFYSALGWPIICCWIFLLRETVTICYFFFFSELKKKKNTCMWFLALYFNVETKDQNHRLKQKRIYACQCVVCKAQGTKIQKMRTPQNTGWTFLQIILQITDECCQFSVLFTCPLRNIRKKKKKKKISDMSLTLSAYQLLKPVIYVVAICMTISYFMCQNVELLQC